jgi:hypothetical protein
MTVLHTGSTKKFASGWEKVFVTRRERAPSPSAPTAAKKASASTKPSAAKKRTSHAGKKRPAGKSNKRG